MEVLGALHNQDIASSTDLGRDLEEGIVSLVIHILVPEILVTMCTNFVKYSENGVNV